MRKLTKFMIAACVVLLLLFRMNSLSTTKQATAFDPRQSAPAESCISIVGDSIPHGSVVFLVPGHGFPALRTEPIAVTLQRQLSQRGLGNIEVHDRSVSAANLSTTGKSPYQHFPEFSALLQDNCRFIVMSGWNNDLNVVRQTGAAAYIDDLYHFARLIKLVNPQTEILMLSHYWGEPQDFVEGFGVGVTEANYQAHLISFENECQAEGSLGRLENVHCLMIPPIFNGLTPDDFVVLQRSPENIDIMLYEPIPDAFAPLLEVYWRDNPGASLTGDGVHLSEFGKRLYSEAIIDALLSIASDL